MNKYQVILCIVNSGFTDEAMAAAKQYGAKGGTVFHARGTVSKEAEKFFNVTIQPEKEIVMILVENKLKDNILKALYHTVGTNTQAQGIAFSLPVSDVVGVGTPPEKKAVEAK